MILVIYPMASKNNEKIVIIDNSLSNSDIKTIPLNQLIYGGYDVLKRREVALGNYNKKTGMFTTTGDKFIMINIDTNGSINLKADSSGNFVTEFWAFHNKPIPTYGTSVDNAVPLYCHIEDKYFCFTTRHAKLNKEKKDSDKKIHLIGRKGKELYFYSHVSSGGDDVKNYRGFDIYDPSTSRKVDKIYYCTPYKIKQVNNEYGYINMRDEKGIVSIFDPNNKTQAGSYDTFIFFPYINSAISTCMSFRPIQMNNMTTGNIWFGKSPKSLIDSCKVFWANKFCKGNETKHNVEQYPMLSSACFDIYRTVFYNKPYDNGRELFDDNMTKQCQAIYHDKNIKNIQVYQKCACQYPVYDLEEQGKVEEKTVPEVDKQTAHCFYTKCNDYAYKTFNQERAKCATTVCYAGNLTGEKFRVIQICKTNESPDEISDSEDEEYRYSDDEDSDTEDIFPEKPKDSKEPEDIAGKRLRTILVITSSVIGIVVVSLILYILFRKK